MPKAINSSPITVGNGNAAASSSSSSMNALIPMSAKSYPQQLISYPPPTAMNSMGTTISAAPALSSRSGSIASTHSAGTGSLGGGSGAGGFGNLRALASAGGSFELGELSHYPHHHHAAAYSQEGNFLLRGAGSEANFVR